MRRTILITIVLMICLGNAFGQHISNKLVLTKEQSDNWIAELKESSIDVQLKMIRVRILLDTGIYIHGGYPDGISSERVEDGYKKENRVPGYYRPVIVFNGKCELYSADINNNSEPESIKTLAQILTIENVKKVTVNEEGYSELFGGSRSDGGIILLTIHNGKVCKKIKKIDFGVGLY